MRPRYDMLVIDLDGTLLDSGGAVSSRNAAAVEAAREAGIEVVIATGRSLAESREALAAINHTGTLIAAGGSLLCDVGAGRTIARRTMPQGIVKDITHWLVDRRHRVLILKDAHAAGYDYLIVGDGELDPASCWWFDRMGSTLNHVATIDDDPHPEDSVRAGAVASETILAPQAHHLRNVFGDRCCMQHWSAVTQTHATNAATHLLEIFACDVNKWSMLHEYCSPRGITMERIAAIGDGLNDVELLANVGLGIAMANASPQVRQAAKTSTEHHDHDGVAVAIDRILGGEW